MQQLCSVSVLCLRLRRDWEIIQKCLFLPGSGSRHRTVLPLAAPGVSSILGGVGKGVSRFSSSCRMGKLSKIIQITTMVGLKSNLGWVYCNCSNELNIPKLISDSIVTLSELTCPTSPRPAMCTKRYIET